MNASFAGKKLLVVGGTSGMGFETAKLVLKNGGSVVLVGNRQDKAEQARQALAADGQVSIIVADLMKEEGMQTTPNKMIHIGKPIELSHDFFDQLDHLYQVAYDEDSNIRKEVHQMVDTYHYDENTTHGVK